jgi:hypothetical protein
LRCAVFLWVELENNTAYIVYKKRIYYCHQGQQQGQIDVTGLFGVLSRQGSNNSVDEVERTDKSAAWMRDQKRKPKKTP